MNRAIFTLLLGLTGYFLLRAWLPTYDALAWGSPIHITRAQAIELAQRAAAAEGIDTKAWRFGVSVQARDRRAAAFRTRPSVLIARFPLAEIQVGAFDPATQRSMRMTMAPDGTLIAWRLHDTRIRQRRDDQDDPAAAEAEMRKLVGEATAGYEKTVSGARSQDGFRSAWEYPDPESPGVLARVEVLIRGGRIISAEHQLETGDAALSAGQLASQQRFLASLTYVTVFYWIAIGLTLWGFFSAFLRRFDHLRLAYAALFLGLPLLLIRLTFASGIDSIALAMSDAPGSLSTVRLIVALSEFAPVLLTALVLCAGYAMLPVSERPRWIGMKLLSEARLLSRPVGRETSAGLLFGAAMSAVLVLAARIGLTHPASQSAATSALLDRLPLAQTLDATAHWSPLLPLAIVIPWCLSRKGYWRWLLLPGLLLGVCALINLGAVSRLNWPASAFTIALLYLLSLVCYRMWGILAAAIAPASAVTLYACALQLAMPAAGLQSSGWTGLLIWSALLFISTVLGWRGDEVSEEEVAARMDPPTGSVSRSERERLSADFEVARRAQQDMLPSEAPAVEGYTLSGSCQPALEVGGDLFDYIHFPSGELGLCVADVSGKGVSASLYMTMTKGMLVAAKEEPADLALILSRLNRHLKSWGRKKTFVTMSLALLEAETGRLLHARAGHNPPVLMRDGKARLLQPKGLGLGLAGPASFDRVLEVEQIDLEPGDCFVLYSDGLTECMNRDMDQYGEERLLRVLERSAGLPAAEVEEAVLRDVSAFQGAADAHDDLTILVLRRELAAEPAIA